jgi:hypothetical protein
MHGEPSGWSHTIQQDADGTFRLEIIDEDGETWPVARQVTRGQAERLVERIVHEARQERKPIKVVIRDPNFMAATVITVKRLPI